MGFREEGFIDLRKVSKCFLISVNSVLALISLGILGGGLYVYLNYAVFSAFVSQEAILYVASAGAISFLLCLTGIIGACCDQFKFLCPYLFFIIILIAGEVLVGILALNYLGVLDSAAAAAAAEGNVTLDATEKAINNFVLKAYFTCCVSNENFCDPLPADPNYCEGILFCDEYLLPTSVCIDETGAGRSKDVDKAICSALQGFNLDTGSQLVGPSINSCGGGDPAQFVEDLTSLAKQQLSIAGYAAIGLGVLEILIVLFTTYLLFKGDPDAIRRAMTRANYAVAVATPLDPETVDPRTVRNSIGRSEELETTPVSPRTMDSHGKSARLSVDRRSARRGNAGPDIDV